MVVKTAVRGDGMLDRKTLQALGCWDGYKLDRVVWPEGESRTLALYLKPVSKVMYYEECGSKCRQVHETVVRRVRDRPLFEYRVVLHVPRRRVWCDQCGGRGSSGSNGWGDTSVSQPGWRRPVGSCYAVARCRLWRLSMIWAGIPSNR